MLVVMAAPQMVAVRQVVADTLTRQPLAGVTVFDRRGNPLGACGRSGTMPHIPDSAYPLTLRCIGYDEKRVTMASADTVFMTESFFDLPEVTVESTRSKVLHILGYVREYSTMTTLSDTIFMFREKMVDYIVAPGGKGRFRGWRSPRPLKSRSYYRFSNDGGLDSVSDASPHHFSWSDWVGIAPAIPITSGLTASCNRSDTIHGRYSPAEIWSRRDDRVSVDVNVLADTIGRRWVPYIAGFFDEGVEFDTFRARFNYADVVTDTLRPSDLTGYSFNIESTGRGRDMFMFNRRDERFYVSTYAEVYVVDKEYITVDEARKWERLGSDKTALLEICEPADAPALQPDIVRLTERVDSMSHDTVRLAQTPDRRLVGKHIHKQNLGDRVLQMFKTLTGISRIRHNRHQKESWREFKKEQLKRNR